MGKGGKTFLEKSFPSLPQNPSLPFQRLSTLSNPSSQLSPSFEGKRGMKGYKREEEEEEEEEERRAPFPSKYLRRGSSGTRLRKRQLYIESCSSIQSTALLYTYTQSAASSVPHPTGRPPRGLPTSQKSFSHPPYPPHHLHLQNKTPSGIAAFGGFGGVPVRHPRTGTYCT